MVTAMDITIIAAMMTTAEAMVAEIIVTTMATIMAGGTAAGISVARYSGVTTARCASVADHR